MSPSEFTVEAMLCDFAEVSGNKLFISGAGINLIATNRAEAPHAVNFALALLVRIPWNATNQQHTLRVELMSDSADGGPKRVPINNALPPNVDDEERGNVIALFNAGRSPMMQVGEETLMPIAFALPGLPLPDVGSYFFDISIDGTQMDRVSFRITTVLNMPSVSGQVA